MTTKDLSSDQEQPAAPEERPAVPTARQEPEMTKVSFNLPSEVVDDLRLTARSQGISVTQLLRNAIALQSYISGEMNEGSKLLFEREDGKVREVVIR